MKTTTLSRNDKVVSDSPRVLEHAISRSGVIKDLKTLSHKSKSEIKHILPDKNRILNGLGERSKLQPEEEGGEVIRIYHECEGRIEKSVQRIAVWHHEAC